MNGRGVLVALAACAVLATGCSGEVPVAGSRSTTPSTTVVSAKATTTSARAPDKTTVCDLLHEVTYSELLHEALILTSENDRGILRARFAEAYRSFGDRLATIARLSPPALASTIQDWSGSSAEIAHYVTTRQPRPGIVMDLGPAHDRSAAAQAAAEKTCGRDFSDAPG